MMNAFFRLLTELSSRKTISQWIGKFAKSKWSKGLIPTFIKIYGIRAEEAERHPDEYESLNAFFTRSLKNGARTIDPDSSLLVCPVDGVITGMGELESGKITEVKGQDYSLEELLNHSPRMEIYTDGFYFVLYLSPTDYHRIHSPVTGTIVEKEHIAGKVYPVNEFGLRHMRKVLSRNERQVTYIRHDRGEVAVVKVGAMNVSSIQYVQPLKEQLERGDDLAYFEFGSTVVLLMDNDTFSCHPDLQVGSRVRMGQALGKLYGKTK